MRRRPLSALSLPLASLALVVGTLGCRGHGATADPMDADTTSTTETTGADDGGVLSEEEVDASRPEGPVVAVSAPVTPVFNVREWPATDPSKTSEARAGAQRLGYLRWGTVIGVKKKVTRKQNCLEGWYELVTGGFVCGKYVTTDLKAKELATAPHPPRLDAPLPYDYGLNLTNGTPLYRRRPFRTERREIEKGLAVGKTKKKDGGSAPAPPPVTDASGNVPWYLQDHHGARPNVKLDDLKSNEGGNLVAVRMVRGFYLSLDKELSTSSGKFWRTTLGFLAPADHILVHKTKTEFEGVRFDAPGEKRRLPLGWVVSPRARKYHPAEGEDEKAPKKMKRTDTIDRFTIVQLTGKKLVVDDRNYYETDEGFYLRDIDGAITRPGAAPQGLGAGEKWIDVNLSTQSLVAFEGDKPVFATILSSGRHNADPAKDHRTVQGSFDIREKHIAATMDNDGASDGPYSIQDVPWIMYFKDSYALHGAFWHASFGRERSHGCVNLQPVDAKRLFEWAGPALPPGWHGVKATKENPGTRVIVHD